jgi:hypothetical protein
MGRCVSADYAIDFVPLFLSVATSTKACLTDYASMSNNASGSKSRLPPSLGMGSSHSSSKTPNESQNLANGLERLTLDGSSANRSQDRAKHASSSGPAFPQPTFYSRGELPAPPRPPPIAMPVPQHYGGLPSRTMQHALAVSNPEPAETTPLSSLSPPRPPRLNKPHSDQAVRPVRRLSTPLSSPTRVRSVPTSPGPLSDDDQDDPDRCRARTKASGNPRCKNRRPRGVTIPLEEFETDFQSNYYCKTHLSQQVEKGGFYSSRSLETYKQSNHQNDGYVKYSGVQEQLWRMKSIQQLL